LTEIVESTGAAHHLNVYKIPQAHYVLSAQWYLDRFPCSCGCGDSIANTLTLCQRDLDTTFGNPRFSDTLLIKVRVIFSQRLKYGDVNYGSSRY
jgi:hypothetical protein